MLDRMTDGLKPSLVRDLGATYHAGELGDVPGEFDVIIECTGAPGLVFDVAARTSPDGIVCLAGVSAQGARRQIDVGTLNRAIVLGDRVIFGSVNANRRALRGGHRRAGRRGSRVAGAARHSPRAARPDWRDAFARRPTT